jgi:hypothetical protein
MCGWLFALNLTHRSNRSHRLDTVKLLMAIALSPAVAMISNSPPTALNSQFARLRAVLFPINVWMALCTHTHISS